MSAGAPRHTSVLVHIIGSVPNINQNIRYHRYYVLSLCEVLLTSSFTFCSFMHKTAMNLDWYDVDWGTSTDAMSTEAPRQTSSHKFRQTLRRLGHLDWRDVKQGTSKHIHVERYRWLRAIHHSKTAASVYICSCVSPCEKILTRLLLFIPVKYSHEISCLQPKTKRWRK